MKINIFDIDETLVVTNSKIRVFDKTTKKLVSELTPQEFNQYIPKKNHKLDFSDFQNLDILKNGRNIYWVQKILEKTLMKGGHVGIITMRSNKKVVQDFLSHLRFSIPSNNIFAVSDPVSGIDVSLPREKRKKEAVRKFVERGFTHLRMFDDDLKNLQAIKELEQEYPEVKIETKYIKDQWIPKINQ